MTLWPRTLLWRSVLLIAGLLVVAHLAWLQIFRASEIEPRALQAAQQIVSVVNLTRAALVTADPGRRYALLDELAQREGIQVYAGDPDEAVPALPDRPFLRIMAAQLRERLGEQTRVTLEREVFLRALQRVALLAQDKTNSVKLSFTPDNIEIFVNAQDVGEAQESLTVKYNGPDMAIAFNPEYLMAPFRNLDADEIYLDLIDEVSPGVLKINTPFLYVLMPMRVSQ